MEIFTASGMHCNFHIHTTKKICILIEYFAILKCVLYILIFFNTEGIVKMFKFSLG